MSDLFGDLSLQALGLAQPPPVVVPALPPLFTSTESELQNDGAPVAENEFGDAEFAVDKAIPEAQSILRPPSEPVSRVQTGNTRWESNSPSISRVNYGPENMDSGASSENKNAGSMGLDVDPQNKEYQVQSIKPRPARTAPLLEAEEAAAPRESAQSPRILSAQVKDFETSQEKPSQTTPVRTQRRPGDLGKPAVEQTGPDSPNVTIIEATPPDRLRSGSEASPIKSMEAAEQYESQPPAGLTASPVKTPQESQEAEASSQKRLAPAQLRQDEAGRPEVERTGKLIQQAAFQPAARPADRPAQKIKSFELLEATVDSSPTAAQQQGLGRAPRDEGEAFLNPVELLRSSTAAAMGAPEGLRRTAPASVSLEAPVWDTRSSLVIPARNQTRMQAIAPEEAFSSGKAAPGTDKGIGTATDMTASSNYAPENRIKTEVAPAGPPEKSSSPAYSTKMSQFTKVQPAQMEASGKKWLQSFPATKPDQRAEDNVPIIRVSIGRVVVRGSLPQAKAQSHPQAEESQPSLSLDDYLKNSRRRV